MYASSESQGDAAASQTSYHRLRAGQYAPPSGNGELHADGPHSIASAVLVAELTALDGISKAVAHYTPYIFLYLCRVRPIWCA